MSYSPMTRYLKSLKDKLAILGLPIYFKLPDVSVSEPFLVIGANSSDTSQTAQTGPMIEVVTISVDVFLSNVSRTEAEEMKSRAIRVLGRSRKIFANVILDDSVGREVYHIALTISDIIY
ncbi:hypothetical protein [Streptococcus cuniculipharyngis]|uniref:DUF3168 domain-containing protein n=1 Tax=Streptococcus cuniculipharyngis TaxID=1562651 RepID=A0A5C5SGV3_9STRE|nr:hypothetical protein [Streptococcus cuniculipharyngis]TWS99141.1 hypothetical protein FRX57_02780 [Streptococcus cuniculipharyngis]